MKLPIRWKVEMRKERSKSTWGRSPAYLSGSSLGSEVCESVCSRFGLRGARSELYEEVELAMKSTVSAQSLVRRTNGKVSFGAGMLFKNSNDVDTISFRDGLERVLERGDGK